MAERGTRELTICVPLAPSRFDPNNGHRDGGAAMVISQIHPLACPKPQEMQFASEMYTGAVLGKIIL